MWRLYTQKFNCEIMGPRPKLLLLLLLLLFFCIFVIFRDLLSLYSLIVRFCYIFSWTFYCCGSVYPSVSGDGGGGRDILGLWSVLDWGPVCHHNLGKVCCRKWRQRTWRHRKSHDRKLRDWRHFRSMTDIIFKNKS